MTCVQIAGGVVCMAPQGITRRRVMDCPTCKRRRRFSCSYGSWYGETASCLGCGDRWTDGDMHGRPAKRGWRDEYRAAARREWDNALTPGQYRAAVKADLDEMFGPDVDDVPTGDVL